jgi:hypothetical protein
MNLNFNKDFKNHCITCKFYDLKDINVRGFRCTKFFRPMALDESCIGNYEYAEKRTNDDIKKAIKWITKRGYDPKPDNMYWYLTSTICKILKYNDNSKYMEAFKNFKSEFLLKDKRGILFLYNYDICGCFLSNILLNSYNENKENTIIYLNYLVNNYLNLFVLYVKNEFYDEALNIYINFINDILNKYNIIYKTKDINDEEINKTYLNSNFNKVLTKI